MSQERYDVRGKYSMDRYRVGVVIPAFNESATISGVVEAAKAYGVPIVVDDGSSDNTSELAEKSGAVVITHPENNGYDFSLNSGFKTVIMIVFIFS